MAQNPFADPVTNNAWEQPDESRPQYGDDEMNAWQGGGWHPQEKTEAHPMQTYRAEPVGSDAATAWRGQQQQQPVDAYQHDGGGSGAFAHQPTDAYQYAGTRYADRDRATTSPAPGDSYSRVATTDSGGKHSAAAAAQYADASGATAAVSHAGRPSGKRFGVRMAQLVAAVGHLGFAAGASPFSDHEVPFSNKSCFYFLFAVAILTILWSCVHIVVYGYRRFAHGQKMRRPIMIAIDGILTVFWGAGTIVEIARFQCPPGGFDKWCDFYNVSIFFGMLSFILYLLTLLWDFYGALRRR